jgi:hypothetical protein
MVCWAVRGGRRALFGAFGLGKTVIQLETTRLILEKSGGGRGLIVLPLGVRQEFMRDAAMLGLSVKFIRSIDEAGPDGIYLTNYETVRDGKLDPQEFTVLSLDEAGVLRGFGGTKTFRELMKLFEGTATFRFVATATNSSSSWLTRRSWTSWTWGRARRASSNATPRRPTRSRSTRIKKRSSGSGLRPGPCLFRRPLTWVTQTRAT